MKSIKNILGTASMIALALSATSCTDGNDWDMLKTVGLPACAGQAPAPIHNICKFEACHCNKGCVADLLEYIMSGKAEEDIKKENNKK